MRIIAGTYGGRSIQAAPGTQTRPTTNRVREAWASSIISLTPLASLEGLRVLDPFAGSGALGLELLSRGAQECQFIEIDKAALEVLKTNINVLRVPPQQTRVSRADSLSQELLNCLKDCAPFDVVVLDPPFALSLQKIQTMLSMLAKSGLIIPQSLISYEYSARDTENLDAASLTEGADPLTLSLVRHKKYGTICIDYYLCR